MVESSRGATSHKSYSRTEIFAVSGFFLFLFLLGVFIFRDFGVSVDEAVDHYTGLVNVKYIMNKIFPAGLGKMPYLAGVRDLATWEARHYGAFFQMPASLLPYLSGFTDSRQIYFFRHFLVFTIFFFSVITFYQIIRMRFQNWIIAMVGAVLLVLSPRIFADAFYNSKDIVFLSLMLFGWWTLHKFRLHKKSKWLITHAFFCAAALNTRVMALTLPGLTFLWLGYEFLFSAEPNKKQRSILLGILYLFFFSVFLIILWPYLWENQLEHLIEIYAWLRRNGQSGFSVLYWGKFYPFSDLPRHYILSFIFITTPLVYILWFFAGAICALRNLVTGQLSYINSEPGRQDITAGLLLAVPLIMVIGTRAILYDGWRHLYFIYPAILYFSILGFYTVWDFLQAKIMPAFFVRAFVTVHIIYVGYIGLKMVKMHPYHHVYFSVIPTDYVQQNFDLDYWGLSYREGFEYVLKHDKRRNIKVAVNEGWLGVNNLLVLTPEQRTRLTLVTKAEADYFLTEYRWHPQPYTSAEFGQRTSDEIYKVQVDGLKILSVFKLTGNETM